MQGPLGTRGSPSAAASVGCSQGASVNMVFEYYDFHTLWLAVQNSSIGDLVTHSLTNSLRTLLLDRKTATLETCDL